MTEVYLNGKFVGEVENKEDFMRQLRTERRKGATASSMNLRLDEDSSALYADLKKAAQLYYETNQKGQIKIDSPWIDKMINCVATSSFFNTQRMMEQYKKEMWHL